MKVIQDSHILQLMSVDHQRGFVVLVKKYEAPLLRLVTRYLHDVEMARDVVQETFLKIYQNFVTFEGRCSFKNWIYKIAINTAKNKLRSLRQNEDLENIEIAMDCFIEQDLVHQEDVRALKIFITLLPEKQRKTIELRVLCDMSFKEVALMMDCPYDTAKANYRHAMIKIKEMMLSQNAG